MNTGSSRSNRPISTDKALAMHLFMKPRTKDALFSPSSLDRVFRSVALNKNVRPAEAASLLPWQDRQKASQRRVRFADDIKTVHIVKNYRDFPLWNQKITGSSYFDDDDSVATTTQSDMPTVNSGLAQYWAAYDQAYHQMQTTGTVDADLRQTLVQCLVDTDCRTEEVDSVGGAMRQQWYQSMRSGLVNTYRALKHEKEWSLVGGINPFGDVIWGIAYSPGSFWDDRLAAYSRKDSSQSQRWANFMAELDAKVVVSACNDADDAMLQPPLDVIVPHYPSTICIPLDTCPPRQHDGKKRMYSHDALP